MNDVSFHVPYIFGKKQNSTERERERENRYRRKAQLKTEKFGTKRGPR